MHKPISPTVLKTQNGQDFHVGRVFCVGRNYADHAREMGGDPHREPPFYFTKWAQAVQNADGDDRLKIPYPLQTQNFHHEIELVIAMGKACLRVSVEDALDAVWGYAAGLDMTRRDLQNKARNQGRPWDTGKNVEYSCPTGRLMPVSKAGHITKGRIALHVNGAIKQQGYIEDMIWNVSEIIANLSCFYHLQAGDLIYTGTPAGVGAVVSGDKLMGEIEGLPKLFVHIGNPQ